MNSTARQELSSLGAEARAKVEQARARAGDAPMLVGFDANGIQAMLSASSRPIAMSGASALLLAFDEAQYGRPETVFAGGGRGLMVVKAEEADGVRADLVCAFREQTHGGVLATAAVPLRAPDASLALLRLRMGIAKDAAPPPEEDDLQASDDACPDCRVRPRTTTIRRGDDAYESCARCAAFVRAGQEARKDKRSLVMSLEDIEEGGQVAFVSADGNELGRFFASLSTLEALVAGSRAVAAIIGAAHEAGLDAVGSDDDGRVIPLVTGGDDIRVLLPPSKVRAYLEAALPEVERLAASASDLDGVLDDRQAGLLADLKLGAGVLVAPHHFPARRLLEGVHELEAAAKRRCRESGGSTSAIGFRYLTTGDALSGEASDRFPWTPILWSSWPRRVAVARALGQVPRSQVGATLQPKAVASEPEATNHFRYQVARTRAWRSFVDEAAGAEDAWRDPERCRPDIVDQTTLDLFRLLEREERPSR